MLEKFNAKLVHSMRKQHQPSPQADEYFLTKTSKDSEPRKSPESRREQIGGTNFIFDKAHLPKTRYSLQSRTLLQ